MGKIYWDVDFDDAIKELLSIHVVLNPAVTECGVPENPCTSVYTNGLIDIGGLVGNQEYMMEIFVFSDRSSLRSTGVQKKVFTKDFQVDAEIDPSYDNNCLDQSQIPIRIYVNSGYDSFDSIRVLVSDSTSHNGVPLGNPLYTQFVDSSYYLAHITGATTHMDFHSFMTGTYYADIRSASFERFSGVFDRKKTLHLLCRFSYRRVISTSMEAGN